MKRLFRQGFQLFPYLQMQSLTSDWCSHSPFAKHLKFTWTDLFKMRSPIVYQKLSFLVCVNIVSQLIFVF